MKFKVMTSDGFNLGSFTRKNAEAYALVVPMRNSTKQMFRITARQDRREVERERDEWGFDISLCCTINLREHRDGVIRLPASKSEWEDRMTLRAKILKLLCNAKESIILTRNDPWADVAHIRVEVYDRKPGGPVHKSPFVTPVKMKGHYGRVYPDQLSEIRRHLDRVTPVDVHALVVVHLNAQGAVLKESSHVLD